MKLSLKQILKELKELPDPASHLPQQHTTQQMFQKKELENRIKAVNTGKTEMIQTMEKGQPVKMFYKGGVLHREEGPAVLPADAPLDAPAYKGGKYYLYGKRYANFQDWYRDVETLNQTRSKNQLGFADTQPEKSLGDTQVIK